MNDERTRALLAEIQQKMATLPEATRQSLREAMFEGRGAPSGEWWWCATCQRRSWNDVPECRSCGMNCDRWQGEQGTDAARRGAVKDSIDIPVKTLNALHDVAQAALAYRQACRVDIGVFMARSRLFDAVALLDSLEQDTATVARMQHGGVR